MEGIGNRVRRHHLLRGLWKVEFSPGRKGGAQTNWDLIVKAFGCHPKGFSCFLNAVLVLLQIHFCYLHESKLI